MCAQCIRHPINGSVFHSLAVCFFWLLSGWCWNNDRKPASFWWNLKFMNDYTASQQRKWEHFAYFSHVTASKVTIFIQITTVITFPQHALWICCCLVHRVLRFKTMSRFCSPALNAGHGFIYPLNKHWFVSFHMWHTQLKYTQPFHFNVWFAELWLHLKVMPQVRSHCVCCAVCLCLVSLTASVWDWCFRR